MREGQMRASARWGAFVLSASVALAAAMSPARAQQAPPGYPPPGPPPPPGAGPPPVMPASPEVAEIGACLCLGQSLQALSANMSAKRQAYDQLRSQLASMDAHLQRARATLDVNNAQQEAQFRELLAQRDAMFRRSTGPVASQLSAAVSRYNARSSEYNARCANQPRDPVLLAQVQATLTCPPAAP